MSMIERVAMALYERDKKLASESVADFEAMWARVGANTMERRLVGYRANARAAIEAMREPTDGMLTANRETWTDDDADVYRAMIQAALDEG